MGKWLQIAVAVVFFVSTQLHAQSAAPPTSVEPKKPAAETAQAIVKTAQCDGKLIDELQLHLTGVRCMTYFDPGCLGIYSAVGAGFATATSTLAIYPQFREKSAKALFATARDAVRAETQGVLASTEFKTAFAEALNSTDRVVAGKYLTSEASRALAIKSLESMATEDAVAAAKVRATALAAARIASLQAMRTSVSYAAAGATILTGPVGMALYFYFGSANSAGMKCDDNGMRFIDQRPSEDEKSCEFAFNPSGPKFRSFFRENRETQLRVLKNDQATCDYMQAMNEALKGHLLTELQILNRASFSELPACRADGKGVSYKVEFEKVPYSIDASLDSESKKVRSIKMGNLGQKAKGGADDERDQMTVRYRDDGSGSAPDQINSMSPFGVQVQKNFREFLEMSRTDRKYETAVKTLNQSAFWTKVVSSCCEKSEKEGERENCWRDKLPGLKLEQQEKKEKNGGTEPASGKK